MSNFDKNLIERISNTKDDVRVAEEWVSEVVFRLREACKSINDIFELKQSFNLETEMIARSAIAETKALTGLLIEATATHERNDTILNIVQPAYLKIMPLVDEAVTQYQTVKRWFDN